MAQIYYSLQELENKIKNNQITMSDAEDEFAKIFDGCINNSDNRRCAIAFAQRVQNYDMELYVRLKTYFET